MTPAQTDLSNLFIAEVPECWNSFLERFSTTAGCVCYYPSAGSDFRPLIYQHPAAMEQLAFLDSTDLLPGLTKENPLHPGPEYQVPDLWVFSDYCPGEAPSWVESGVLHCDEKVEIKVVEKTEIHPLAKEMTFNVNPSYINLRPGPATGGCSI